MKSPQFCGYKAQVSELVDYSKVGGCPKDFLGDAAKSSRHPFSKLFVETSLKQRGDGNYQQLSISCSNSLK